jgi:predicted Zn-dependent protease
MLEGGSLNRNASLELLGNILSHGVKHRIDQLEAVLVTRDSYLTRFAKSRIHQHMGERNVDVAIRVIADKKQGSIYLNTSDPEKLEIAVERALKIAKVQTENPEFVSLPSYGAELLPKGPELEKLTFNQETAVHSPEAKTNEIRDLINLATTKDEILAGAYLTEVSELAIVNSLGVEVYMPKTLAAINVNIIGPNGAAGYAGWIGRNVKDLNIKSVAKELKKRCRLSKNPKKIEPKSYPTIFEHYAVGELSVFLSSMGFSAKAVQEGWSFMCDKFDTRILSPKIDIWDDGTDQRGLPIPFDYEGVPKQHVNLIEKGMAKGVVYDSFTAGQADKTSTGHALPAPNTMGPQPMNLFVGVGDSSLNEMIEDTRRGLLVTRIHYANPLDPKKTLLTGMTRDGTFLIEKGEITSAVKNLRFTQSLLESLDSTKLVGKNLHPVKSWYGSSTVPALKVDKFTFTGGTEY